MEALVGASGHARLISGAALAVLAAAALLICKRRSRPPPGRLKARGSFEHEDPVSSDAISERRRDFARIVATKRDIWIFTNSSRQGGTVLPVEIPDGASATPGMAEKVAHQKLKFWLQMELGQIEGAIDLGMTSQWPVVDRVINFISVSPGFDFIMRHAVPPMILQAKYVLLISKTGQVRVAWFAFVTDSPQPGMTSGPFVVKLVSENLNAERDGSTHCSFAYTAKASSCGDMEKIISSQLPQILKGIDEDKWELFEQA